MYYKIHHNLTRPLIRTFMTDKDNRLVNLRNNGYKRQRHQYYGAKHSKSFFPYFTKLWNVLSQQDRYVDIIEFKSRLKIRYKPPKCKFYSHGCKQGSKLLTRIRLDRSFLNAHSFRLAFTASPQCDSCGARQENAQYILLHCLNYQSNQKTLLDIVENLDYNQINRNITLAVQ